MGMRMTRVLSQAGTLGSLNKRQISLICLNLTFFKGPPLLNPTFLGQRCRYIIQGRAAALYEGFEALFKD